jgi:methionine synthase II (cobalamin-independent)
MNATSPSGPETFSPGGRATLIGSLPVADHQQGLELIRRYTPEIPLWPQLPANPREGMLVQFAEGFVGLVEGERTYFDTGGDFDDRLLPFFEEFLQVAEDPQALMTSRFAVSRERAAGLYLLREQAAALHPLALKGQITGPFTMLTGLQDQDQRLSYYNPSLKEMVVQGLALKAAWQTRFLKETGLPVIIFIDEPALAGLGSSSFISIATTDIAQDLAQVSGAIQAAGGLAGVHVCANTEWELLLNGGLDVISFDAYEFFDRFLTCRPLIHAYLERGGIIAWGLVPTGKIEVIEAESTDSLVARWEAQAAGLATERWTLPALLERTMITPSCGTGSLPLAAAEKVLRLTSEVSATLRQRYLPNESSVQS